MALSGNIIIDFFDFINQSIFGGSKVSINNNVAVTPPQFNKTGAGAPPTATAPPPQFNKTGAVSFTSAESCRSYFYNVYQTQINDFIKSWTGAGTFINISAAEVALFTMANDLTGKDVNLLKYKITFSYTDFNYIGVENLLSLQAIINLAVVYYTGYSPTAKDDFNNMFQTVTGAFKNVSDSFHHFLYLWTYNAVYFYCDKYPTAMNNLRSKPNFDQIAVGIAQTFSKNNITVYPNYQKIWDMISTIHKQDIKAVEGIALLTIGLVAAIFTAGASLGLLGASTAATAGSVAGGAKLTLILGENIHIS